MSKNIYISGVFDLFHYGHMVLLRTVMNKYPNANILAGVHSDSDVQKYKRLPIMTMNERIRAVQESGLAHGIIASAPFLETEAFYKKHDIDIIIHAHSAEEHENYLKNCSPYAGDRFVRLDYTSQISTSELIKRIQDRIILK